MLTPIEIQSKNFKSGIGYDRKDVDSFMREILLGYERLYKENVELKDKLSVLNDGIQYYKTIEKTLQKALVLAEQTAEETRQAALKSAKAIEKEARGKADLIIADAKNELNHINQMITGLTQQYECYKVQYRQLAAAQIDLLQSPTFELTLMNGEQLKTSYTNPVDSNNLSTSLAQDSQEFVNISKDTEQSMKNSLAEEEVIGYEKDEANKELVKKLVEEFVDEKVIDKQTISKQDLREQDLSEQDLSEKNSSEKNSSKKTSSKQVIKKHLLRKPQAEELFTKEELEVFEKIANYVNNESNDNKNDATNVEDSDFTMVEEAAISLEDTSKDNKEKKESSMESEFEFIDFEVNLD